MKTLADMTPEQREACVGMWCDILSDGTHRRTDANHIIRYVNTSYRRKPGFAHLIAISPDRDVVPDELVVPRFDLPRAFGPDGKPVKEVSA